MIIQCDHCRARFKMDDSKLANGPVKVRCAKCKEVFIVQPEESAVEKVVPPVPQQMAPATAGTGANDFSFDDSSAADETFAKGADDFSFATQERPVSKVESAPQDDAANEFDWQDGAASAPATPDSSGGFDLSDFDASLATPNLSAGAVAAAADDTDFDFGDVDFSAAAAPAESEVFAKSEQAEDSSMDFGEVSFSDNPVEPPGSKETFSDAPAQAAETEAQDDFLLSFNSGTVSPQASVPPPQKKPEDSDFGGFSFAEPILPAQEGSSPDSALQGEDPGGSAAAGFVQEDQDEELPPSSLTSRKKSSANFPLIVIAGAIVLVIALAGSGVYYFGGATAFSKVGLGFLIDWYGGKTAEEGSIALKGVTAAYAVNSTAGELFVVRGEAVNNFKKPRASIQIKVSLLGPGGVNLVTKSAYCGNSLSDEQLATLPLARIEEIMNNQFGDSLTNIGLKPGGTIPFVVVSPLPKEATDYNVVVGGSTVASQ